VGFYITARLETAGGGQEGLDTNRTRAPGDVGIHVRLQKFRKNTKPLSLVGHEF
jgi:hypothetical protein